MLLRMLWHAAFIIEPPDFCFAPHVIFLPYVYSFPAMLPMHPISLIRIRSLACHSHQLTPFASVSFGTNGIGKYSIVLLAVICTGSTASDSLVTDSQLV